MSNSVSKKSYIPICSSEGKKFQNGGNSTLKLFCYGLDFLCFLGFSVIVVLYKYRLKPFRRGFYCDDETINKPFKENTIPFLTLLGISQAIALFILGVVELIEKKKEDQDSLNYQQSGGEATKTSNLCGIAPILRRMILVYVTYLYGLLITIVITCSAKFAIGRLRPHFLTVCKPNWDAFNCTDHRGFARYVTDYECTGKASLIREARLSFPSGHSSCAMYSVIFFALCMEFRLRLPYSTRYMKLCFQIIIFLLGLLCALSRISDFKHHWSDVLCGSLLGIMIAFLIALHTMRWRFANSPDTVNEAEQGLLNHGISKTIIDESDGEL